MKKSRDEQPEARPRLDGLLRAGGGAYLCRTALAWVRCAWVWHLCPPAPRRTAAPPPQTGNPWRPYQGPLAPPPPPRSAPRNEASRNPHGSRHLSPWRKKKIYRKWRFQGGEEVKSQLCSPAQRNFSSAEKAWEGGRSHGSPCGAPGSTLPRLLCSPPGEGPERSGMNGGSEPGRQR